MRVDAAALPVHTDATARVAPVSLLGERYIDLDPGTPAAPELPRDQRITMDRTGQVQDLQNILDTLDDPTSASLAALVTMLGQGTENNGENVQKTLAALAPAMGDTDQLVKVLADQNELLGRVVDQVQPVTTALAADDGRTLDGLVGSAKSLLATTAQRDAQLRATLTELPSTLAAARQTLADLTGTAQATTVTLGNLRPTTDSLKDISAELQAFADSADPALASADPVLDRASEMLDAAQPIAAQLRAAGPNLQQTVDGAEPIVDQLNGNLGGVLGFIRNWALTTNQKDGLSHYFRAHFVINPDAVSGYLPGGLPTESTLPAPDPSPNPQIDEPGAHPATTPAPAPGLLQSQPDAAGSATGLSPEQEQGAVGFLLGGK
jgi:phospholipid/cholesterol/gamma-HCH transport system substrate-binding protein